MRGCSFELTTPLRIGICEASGIDDERATVCRDFDVQQIVMTVTTVSDWTTIEDETIGEGVTSRTEHRVVVAETLGAR